MIRRSIFLISAALLTASPLHAQTAKRIVKDPGQPVFLIPATSDELGLPSMIIAGESSAQIFDFSDAKVRRIAIPAGGVTKRFGGFGGGPGEFARPTGMGELSGGRTWVYDADQRRITLFDKNGNRITDYLTPPSLDRLYRVGNTFVGMSARSPGQAIVLDSAGKPVGHVIEPQWAVTMDPFARTMVVAADGNTGAIAFGFSGRIMVAKDRATKYTELPVIETRPILKDTVLAGGAVRKRNARSVWTVRSISIKGNLLYALNAGAGETANRYVDVYDLTSLTYKYSFLLRRPALMIAVTQSGIATVEQIDDVPASSFY